MTRLRLGRHVVEADVGRTRAFYDGEPPMDGGCGCDGCRNYDLWSRTAAPAEVRGWLEALGVDLNKPAEVMLPFPGEGGVIYLGFFHVCGRVLWDRSEGAQTDSVEIARGFSAWLSDDVALLEDGFPQPCFQLDFRFRLPWLLDEPMPE